MAGSYFSTDTIVAIATSLAGDAGVGIIRLSGPKAVEAARAVAPEVDRSKPRYLNRIEVRDLESGATIDDGLAVYFPEGQSFTGEEVVELQLHGGRFLLQSILKLLIGTGLCRLALPGEFSFRAVKGGKLNLQGAEALGQIIGAKSMFEVQAARRNLSASRTEAIEKIAAKIRELLAQSELSIDFIDQDVEVISAGKLRSEIEGLLDNTRKLLAQLEAASRIAKGLQVSLVGEPNAGKSTLFNALLAEDRAIVSPEAGTTRDVITEEIVVGPYLVRLADTAGLRETEGSIEKEGIARARSLLEASEAILLVVDASKGISAVEQGVSRLQGQGRNLIVALNKWELLDPPAREAVQALASKLGVTGVPISALRSEGVTELLAALRKRFDEQVGIGLSSFLPTEFQLQMLLQCQESLAQVKSLVESSGLGHPELVSAALSSAVRALSDLVGETTPDTVLEKIFSEFCIGK